MLDGVLLDGVTRVPGGSDEPSDVRITAKIRIPRRSTAAAPAANIVLRPVGPVLGVVVVSGHRGMLAAARYLQRSSSSLERSASANCQNGPKLIRATPSGPYDAGSDLSGNAIALTGSGSSEVKRRNVSGS